MSEFGHIGIISDWFCIDSWGVGPFVIEVKGRSYRFEDSDRFGPSLIRKDGNPLVNQPRERSPFWEAHHLWVQQGRKTADDDQTCLYDQPA